LLIKIWVNEGNSTSFQLFQEINLININETKNTKDSENKFDIDHIQLKFELCSVKVLKFQGTMKYYIRKNESEVDQKVKESN